MTERYYSYRQGTAYGKPLVRYEDNNSGCLSIMLSGFLTVAAGTISFFIVYFGFKLFVEPWAHDLWTTLVTALGG